MLNKLESNSNIDLSQNNRAGYSILTSTSLEAGWSSKMFSVESVRVVDDRIKYGFRTNGLLGSTTSKLETIWSSVDRSGSSLYEKQFN